MRLIDRTRSCSILMTMALALPVHAADNRQDHDHAAHDHGYGTALEVSAEARAQLDAAIANVRANYDTPEKAEAAGWQRPRSSTPTMGEHWTNRRLMAEPGVDPMQPEILMFAPIAGELTLVGASWVNRQSPEAPLPQLFDGLEAMWHRHDASDPLNRAGAAAARALGRGDSQRASGIVMNHLWFIDAQEGEFTGHDHWLPFMDAGLPVPPATIGGDLLAQAALGIAEVNDSAFIMGTYYDMLDAEAQAEVQQLRDEIAALMPEYAAAHAAGDGPAMTAILGEIGAWWTDIRAVHSRELQPAVVNLLDVAYGNMTSGHEHGPGGH